MISTFGVVGCGNFPILFANYVRYNFLENNVWSVVTIDYAEEL
jgi:hypothetical protein